MLSLEQRLNKLETAVKQLQDVTLKELKDIQETNKKLTEIFSMVTLEGEQKN